MATLASGLLHADPEPSLLLDRHGAVVDANPEATRLARSLGLPLARLLPVNTAALAQACQLQGRAIQDIQREVSGKTLSWAFIPLSDSEQILARGRDLTDQMGELRDARRASRLYRLIIENTTDLISRHAPDGSFVDASPASWRLLGYWPEELRGRPVSHVLATDEGDRWLASMRQQLRDQGYATQTLRLRHRDGSERWFEIASRAIRETYSGTVVEVISVSRDITSRIQSEDATRRLAQVVEANTDLVLFIGRDGTLSHLNPAARRALGVGDSETQPLRIQQLLQPTELERFLQEGLEQAEQQGAWETETRFLTASGDKTLPVSVVVLSHRGADYQAYYSVVARDMTEREAREHERRQHQEELAQASRMATLGELASGIAHEMNQPLATIINYANGCQRYLNKLPEQPQELQRVRDGLTRITRHANHAAEVIRRLRAFLGKGQKRVEQLPVNQVVGNAVQLCQWDADKYRVDLVQDLDPAEPGVYADRVLLEQVLINLLRNAIEANREQAGKPASQVVVRTRLGQGGELFIEVDDQGPGLDDAGLEQMFTPFFTAKPDGLGLGLSMSRSIVEGFGGYLDAQRLPTGGLRLTCRFPPRADSGRGDATRANP